TRLQAPPYDALAPHFPKIAGRDADTARAVRAILDDVRAARDAGVREHTRRLDGVDLPPGDWEVPAVRWQEALERIPRPLRAALELAVQRVRDYHANQADEGSLEGDADGTEIGMRFVAEVKRQVAGDVGIDMLAGPTEVLIIADETAEVRFVAADLIAQAEHDEDACAWCVTTSPALADALEAELARQVARSPRKAI